MRAAAAVAEVVAAGAVRSRASAAAICSPNAVHPRLTTLDGPPPPAAGAGAGRGGAGFGGRGGGGGGRGGGGRGGAGAGAAVNPMTPRVLLSFPTDANDLLLSGGLVGGEALAGRAVVVDAPIGKGHV